MQFEPPGRRTLADPGISFTRVRFLEGQGPPQTETYQPDGTPARRSWWGNLHCTFLGTRTIDTTYGAGLVADVAILNDGDLAGLTVSPSFAPPCWQGLSFRLRAGTKSR